MDQELDDLRKKNAKKIFSQSLMDQIRKNCEQKLFDKICLKYNIMMVRNKISYTAFYKKVTINELFF